MIEGIQTALVVGGDGRLGGALVAALRGAGVEVTPTTRRPNRPGCLFLNLEEPPETLPRVDVVYLVAARPSFVDCETYPSATWRVNVDAPIELARMAICGGSFVVFTSSEAVENCGSTAYGRQKLAAELAIRLMGQAILRPSRIPSHLVDDVAALMVRIGRDRRPGVYRW